MTERSDEGGAFSKQGAALVVASLNLRHGLAWDGVHSWPLRRRAAVRCLESLHAEIVGLQEVHGFQQRYVARHLDGYAALGAGRDDGRRRGERCAVLYRPGRLRLTSWTVRWFSDTPGWPGSRSWGNTVTRLVTLCRFVDRHDGCELGVANMHWDGASAASRLRSAEALLRWLDPALPWLVVGDLNATADDPAVTRLVEGGLRDPLARLGTRGPGAGTHHAWDGATDGTRIDYVLASPHWDVLEARIEHPRPGGQLPSDHWPVVATVALRDSPAGRPPETQGRTEP